MENEIAYITSLIGNQVRTKILWSLIDNKAYTATELAITADTTAQNISMHLKKLVQAQLLSVESQGRHKYYRFSRPEVAYAIEALAHLIPEVNHKQIVSQKDNSSLRQCRTCYDHLAGKVGVALTEALLLQQIIKPKMGIYEVTKKGMIFFSKLEIDTDQLKKQRRLFARPCLDWSERKHHLAGSLGAALLEKMLHFDYMRRTKNSRAIVITANGKQQLQNKLKMIV